MHGHMNLKFTEVNVLFFRLKARAPSFHLASRTEVKLLLVTSQSKPQGHSCGILVLKFTIDQFFPFVKASFIFGKTLSLPALYLGGPDYKSLPSSILTDVFKGIS